VTDIATLWSVPAGTGDWAPSIAQSLIWTDEKGNAILDQTGQPVAASFTAGTGLVAGDDLLTAVLISLFTDAQAETDDTIPDGSDDPRGWWGGAIGSKLWLRMRSKALPVTLALVKHDIEQALAWLISDGVAASVTVLTAWVRRSVLGAQVTIRRADGTTRALAFAQVWENR
jgi:phage gp46-like protein